MDWHFLFNCIGMASFACSGAAYLMTNILKLRMLAIASGLLGLIYNATLASGPLWLVLFWLGLFLLINVGRLVQAIVGEKERPLAPADRALLVATFPSMHSRDWALLRGVATERAYSAGDVLLDFGAHTNALSILATGVADEVRVDGRILRRAPSTMWGELSFVTSQQFDGSPCRIAAGSDVVVLDFDYEALKGLIDARPRMKAALMEGFVRTAGLKHGLLSAGPDFSAGNESDCAMTQHRAMVDNLPRAQSAA